MEVQGLKSTAGKDLNGKQGEVVKHDVDTGRWGVKLDDSQTVRSLQHETRGQVTRKPRHNNYFAPSNKGRSEAAKRDHHWKPQCSSTHSPSTAAAWPLTSSCLPLKVMAVISANIFVRPSAWRFSGAPCNDANRLLWWEESPLLEDADPSRLALIFPGTRDPPLFVHRGVVSEAWEALKQLPANAKEYSVDGVKRGDAALLVKHAYLRGEWDEQADGADWRDLWKATIRLGATQARAEIARCLAPSLDRGSAAAALHHCVARGDADGPSWGEGDAECLLGVLRRGGWYAWPREMRLVPQEALEGVHEEALKVLKATCQEALESNGGAV